MGHLFLSGISNQLAPNENIATISNARRKHLQIALAPGIIPIKVLSIFYYEIIDVKNLFIRFIIELFVVVRGEFSHSSIAIS